MKILLVEDNKIFAGTLCQTIGKLPAKPEIVLAESRDSAIGKLDSDFFDVVILDLEIPTRDGAFDIEAEHGEQVFYHAKKQAPGTPVYILTGSEATAFLKKLVREGEKIDLWGEGSQIPTVDYYHKEDGAELFKVIRHISEVISSLESIRINYGGQDIELSFEQKRALKVFTKANGGTSCKVKKLGGLSDAVVLKITVMDHQGHIRCECAAKLGLAKHVHKEIAAYHAEVKHLQLGAFAHVLSYHDQGLRGFSGIFYALADEYKSTFFDFVIQDPAAATEVLKHVREALKRWSSASKHEMLKVSQLRQRLLSDEAFEKIVEKFGLQHLRDLEERTIEIASSCIHGDLHGGNVLVNNRGIPVLIDFGDVGSGFTCLDPLTIELSLFFHPDAISSGAAALLSPTIENWPELRLYVKNNKLKPIIEYCRSWAYDAGPHDESVIIMAYVFVLRQLKYDTVHSDITISLINKIISKL
ncbi:phosphotransferase [Pseudomonas germanica]